MRTAVDQKVARGRAGELGFGLIELIISAALLAIVASSITMVFTGTSRSMSVAAMRDSEATIISSAAEEVRNNPAWIGKGPGECGATGMGSTMQLGSWLKGRLASELAGDGKSGAAYRVSGYARPIDSSADGVCPNDADGVVPDYYDVQLQVAPDAATAARVPQLTPVTQRFQVDFSSRASGGRLVVQGCYVTPQIDERVALGSCEDATQKLTILPPSQVLLGRGGSLVCGSSAECTAWQCANPLLASGCAEGNHADEDYVSISPKPAAGWAYSIVGADPNTSGEAPRTGVLDSRGLVELDGLVPGRYKVTVTASSGFNVVAWPSRSVPASGIATVERGIRSRVVQMFRPAPRASISIPVTTLDKTDPPWVGQPVYPYLKGGRTWRLMAGPAGRIPLTEFIHSRSGDPYVTFTDVEPGLYATALELDDGWVSEMSGGAGFMFISPDGGDPIISPGKQLKMEASYCNKERRQVWIDTYGLGAVLTGTVTREDGTTYEASWKVEKCSSSDGSSADQGGGGSTGNT